MRNITLRIDEEVLGKVRLIAGERATSVNALIRDYLDDLVRQQSRREAARKELVALARKSQAIVGEPTWKRDDLHDR